jgi:glyoxylase-like metal-dependent hydrolase (beta-lactamase superfamily II)
VPPPERISEHVWRYRDTVNVYLIRHGTDAILIDFGTGDVLDHLAECGAERVTDVLLTHHHRDGVQGLPRAVAEGIRIWVPHQEQDLFARVDEHWQARSLANDYNSRQDRFSLLEPVPIAGTLQEYLPLMFAGVTVTAIPTPGHTVGSVSILADVDGQRLCFSGDLITAPGKVWSLAATQWSYNGGEGIVMTILSARDLARRALDLLLPAHGEPMDDPAAAMSLLEERLMRLMRLRKEHPGLASHLAHPFARLTPHFLHGRTSHAYSYFLLSESGKALVIDYGYDFTYGIPAGTDRAARRPWLYNIPRLKEEFGVTSIDVAIPTHYHDDHVAAFNLLRDVEGTRVWAGENMVDVLERPSRYDLPCLWYDPIPVDRSMPLGVPFAWEEYELVLHPLPGHTLYAVAVQVDVDDTRILVVGDQLVDLAWLFYLYDEAVPMTELPLGPLPPATTQNYVYRNRFRIPDYRETAELYSRVKPDIMAYGHWSPGTVDEDHFEVLAERGAALEAIHRELLPLDDIDLGAEGFAAWITPYRPSIPVGGEVLLEVEVLNPLHDDADVRVRMIAPHGWAVRALSGSEEDGHASLRLRPMERGTLRFCVTPPGDVRVRRARVAADVTVADRRLGQQAEALITVA